MLINDYDSIDLDLDWETIRRDIPKLEEYINLNRLTRQISKFFSS